MALIRPIPIKKSSITKLKNITASTRIDISSLYSDYANITIDNIIVVPTNIFNTGYGATGSVTSGAFTPTVTYNSSTGVITLSQCYDVNAQGQYGFRYVDIYIV